TSELYEYFTRLSRERRFLTLLAKPPLRYSPYLNLTAEIWTQRAKARQSQWERELIDDFYEELEGMYRSPGLNFPLKGADMATQLWAQSSQLMHAICRENNMVYLHVLQPNQYDERGKKLSEEEAVYAYN